jgi:DNA-binding NtrC family response regulator
MAELESEKAISSDSNDTIMKLDKIISIHIAKALKRTNGKISGHGSAAEILGVNSNTLRSKMKKLDISHGRQVVKKTK